MKKQWLTIWILGVANTALLLLFLSALKLPVAGFLKDYVTSSRFLIIIVVAIIALTLRFILKRKSSTFRSYVNDPTVKERERQFVLSFIQGSFLITVVGLGLLYLILTTAFGWFFINNLLSIGILIVVGAVISLIYLIKHVNKLRSGLMYSKIRGTTFISYWVILTIFFFIMILVSLGIVSSRELQIVTFEQCVEAGNPVMESFPEQCRTEDGVLFVNWQGAGQFCTQVITPARNPQTGEVREFPTPCDVPEGWQTP